MNKIKELIKKIFGESFYVSLVNIKRNVLKITYLEKEKARIFFKRLTLVFNKNYRNHINKTIEKINDYKNADYIVFHNPRFLGVTSATKELFKNLVPCDDLYFNNDVKKIANTIIENNIKEVYFSAFCYNWKKVIIRLKKLNKNIVIKTYWHGSHSQILDTFGWNRNMEIIELHKLGFVDIMATCKNSIIEFYDKNNYKSVFLNNEVNFDGRKYISKEKNENIKLGIYSANGDWRKNMMCQVGAVKLIENAIIDMVPLNKEAFKLAQTLNIKMEGPNKTIPREELLSRMAKNDVNLYITFSECAPMLPLESLEVGVPCISGNNHHYFKNTPLEKYLIVNNETDVIEIKDKIELCIKDKSIILELYKEWKRANHLYTKKQIEKFIGGK